MSKVSQSHYAVLGILHKKPCSAKDIKQTFNKNTSLFWEESEESVFHIIRSLLEEGLISVDKEIYSITNLGRLALKKWLKGSSHEVHVQNEVLLKLFFGENASVNTSVEHLKDYQHELLVKRDEQRKLIEGLDMHCEEPTTLFERMAHRHRQLQIEGELQWVHESLKLLHEAKIMEANRK